MNWTWFHKLGSPPHFYRLSHYWAIGFAVVAVIMLSWGLVGGLFIAPTDYEQGEAFRIIYVHVPSAWMSLFVYSSIAVAAIVLLIWRMKLAEAYMMAAAPLGAMFTALALITGMLWGKPMWGKAWVWDARLTSELILLFLYFGIMGLHAAIEDRGRAAKATAILAIVGFVNVPIIHYSVKWWNTLHQGAIFENPAKPSIHIDMLQPLLIMTLGFMAYYGAVCLWRMRASVLSEEREKRWVKEALGQ